MSEIGSETVVLVTPVETDMHGDPLPGTGTETAVDGCAVYPRTSEEDENRAATVTDRLVGLLPIHEDLITQTMQIRWRSKTYDVEGSAMPWVFLDGEDAGCQVNLARAGN